MLSKVWDDFTHPFPNFNGCAVEVWEWICHFIPHFLTDVNIFVWRKHENISPCTDSRVNTSYERIASCAGCQFRTRASESQVNSTTRNYAERPNHSSMPHMSKTDRHQPHGITPPAQQQADSEQERFFAGLLTPGTGVWIVFWYDWNKTACLRALAAG